MKGKRLLRAADVDRSLVQDRSATMHIIRAEVEALYPSLEAIQVADIVYKAVMETEIEFKNINYQDGVQYIALTSTAQECRIGPLKRVLPRRRHVNGVRPGVTGTGPVGAAVGDQDQWEFPPVHGGLTKLEKKLIVAKAG